MSRDEATILDMLRAARRARAFIAGLDFAAFQQDEKSQSAVVYQLTVIGEAVRRLSAEFRAAHPVLPWRQIAAMRNVLIHQYDQIDVNEVWKTVIADLPPLITFCERIAPPPGDSPPTP